MWRRKGGSLSGWIVFGGSLLFYACSLAPGIEGWDTGELQTDANALFVAHPTGFPLFVLGGWAFAHLFPFGDPAWRITLFSAIAVCVAASMLAIFVYELTRDAIASTAAGLVFAPVGVVWLTAVRADAHDLALACTSIALVFALRAGRSTAVADVRVAAVAWGCALATHPVALFAFPALVLLAWPALLAIGYRGIAFVAALCLAPLVVYAYVPLRSIAIERGGLDPSVVLGLNGSALVDDGAPATGHAFAAYMLATRFGPGRAFAALATRSGFESALAFAHATLYGGYGVLALAFAFVGIGALGFRTPRIALALATLAFGGIAFAANYPIESSPYRYALAALWAISACVGYGAWWLAAAIVQRRGFASVAAAAALAISLVPTFGSAKARVVERARHSDARTEAVQVVNATADGSVIVSEWTFATPLAYAKYVQHAIGTRRVVSGWPTDFEGSYPTWRKRYGHVYFVADGMQGAYASTRERYVAPRRRFVISEFVP